ncbi:RcnB family protein [Phenylobacterium sp.]|uniref:RcnB family protein n=1 Tax=Phenylobacterium sp. TaxID=1871053 RepID=UPI00391C671A
MRRLLLTLAALAATAGAPFAVDAAFAKDNGPRGRGHGGGSWEGAQGHGRGPEGRRWERPDYGSPPPPLPPRTVRPGGYLPPQYRGAPVEDYPRYRLRPPPEGYAWRRMGDAFVLMDRNGRVFDIIPD